MSQHSFERIEDFRHFKDGGELPNPVSDSVEIELPVEIENPRDPAQSWVQ